VTVDKIFAEELKSIEVNASDAKGSGNE
jgi:hypothetical protein